MEPGTSTTHRPTGEPATLTTVQVAFRLMLAGAALQALIALLFLVQFGTLRGFWSEQMLQSNPDAPISTLRTIVGRMVGSIVALEAILAGPWLWLAIKNRAGRNWARITATVFFAIATVGLRNGGIVHVWGSYEQYKLSLYGSSTRETMVLNALTWLIGLVTIILLWHPRSSSHFRKPLTPHSATVPPAPGHPGPQSEPLPPGYQGGTL